MNNFGLCQYILFFSENAALTIVTNTEIVWKQH